MGSQSGFRPQISTGKHVHAFAAAGRESLGRGCKIRFENAFFSFSVSPLSLDIGVLMKYSLNLTPWKKQKRCVDSDRLMHRLYRSDHSACLAVLSGASKLSLFTSPPTCFFFPWSFSPTRRLFVLRCSFFVCPACLYKISWSSMGLFNSRIEKKKIEKK